MSSNSTSRYLSKENENTNCKDIYTPMFTATLFTTAKIWKQPNCPSTEKWKRRCGTDIQWTIQFSSVAQLCPTLWDPMDCSTPGLPVHHQLPEFAQTHVHWVSDASNHLILCCPLLLLPSVFPNITVFSNECSSHQVAKILEFQLQHKSFQWTLRTDLL